MEQVLMYKDEEARALLKKGVDAVSDAVKITLGSRGQSVIAERKYAPPLCTNDGVTIAKGIEIEGPENQGCLLAKEASMKTNDDAGDGTTTVLVLIQSIVANAVRNLTSGANSRDVKFGMEKAVDCVVSKLKGISRKVKTRKEKEQVASISAGNEEWGKNIVKAIEEVGDQGVVTVEEGSKSETVIEMIEGMQFDSGFCSPYFINKKERYECVLNDPYIVLVDRDVTLFSDISPILEQIVKKSRPYVFICNSIDGEALASCILNSSMFSRKKQKFPGVCVKAPAIGNRRRMMMEDIAVLTGGKLLSNETGYKLEEASTDDLGTCKKIVVSKDFTTIIGGNSDKKAVKGRCKEIREQIKNSESDFEIDKLKNRLAKLTGGIAQIMVGAATDTEMKAKHYKYEDALNATKAAIEEGIVPGGGVAYIECINSLLKLKVSKSEQVGVDIIKDAICSPVRQIAENAGKNGDYVLRCILDDVPGIGYNATTGEFVNMVEEGIIDPVKVTRLALQNAASASYGILTAGCLIVDRPEDERYLQKPKAR